MGVGKSQVLYVVLPVQFEYDEDKGYMPTGYARPFCIFREKVNANLYARDQSAEQLRVVDLLEYGITPKDAVTYDFVDKAKEIGVKIEVEDDEYPRFEIPSTVSDEDLRTLVPLLKMPFYEVIAAPVGDFDLT